MFEVDHMPYKKEGDAKESNCSLIFMEYAPHGNIFDLLLERNAALSEKLARTYFHQLISGLEHMHDQGVAHMDLKLENLMLGYNYALKIIDFDLSVNLKSKQTISKGTPDFRAPELMSERSKVTNFKACDIYSAGIILFSLVNEGLLPFREPSK